MPLRLSAEIEYMVHFKKGFYFLCLIILFYEHYQSPLSIILASPSAASLLSHVATPTVLLKRIDRLRDCTIAAERERGMRREHAPAERVE
ncbi:hypothetical protein Y032_0242g3413 [Ancylostoma ceylanicum]|uniref:Uncharacterized protein n=1 Tax=Ancylostoma ceylanicum TaxID=53326 RepID=A0A016SDK0_9BILA|nr:hypothetical protein Y032_0242g3413 [Ancylostoma ceylanicum]